MLAFYRKSRFAALVAVFYLCFTLYIYAQSGSNSGSISGTVLDPTGAVVSDATIEIHNPVSQYDRSTTTDKLGNFIFQN
ncbi:MAG: carboxypeptidase-like regulatory domain-containing protein, partial [Candidatus Sulfotelmatobacter sp.]